MLARFCEAQFSGSSLPSAIDDECNEKPEDAKNRERDTQRDLGMKLNQVQSSQSNNMSWEVLLNDGHVVQYVNNANIKDLLQDVSLLFNSLVSVET
jgi:methionine-rich copper-binding protein CopC